MVKRLPWIDVVAAAPLVLLALLAADLHRTIATLDPLVVFRLFLLLWVLVHVYLTIERFVESIIEVRDFLRDLEKSAPHVRGLAGIGDRAFWWSVRRVARLSLRYGWPTLLLAGLVVAVNSATWLILGGWRPGFLKGLL